MKRVGGKPYSSKRDPICQSICPHALEYLIGFFQAKLNNFADIEDI